jgi:hypothetical protein
MCRVTPAASPAGDDVVLQHLGEEGLEEATLHSYHSSIQ